MEKKKEEEEERRDSKGQGKEKRGRERKEKEDRNHRANKKWLILKTPKRKWEQVVRRQMGKPWWSICPNQLVTNAEFILPLFPSQYPTPFFYLPMEINGLQCGYSFPDRVLIYSRAYRPAFVYKAWGHGHEVSTIVWQTTKGNEINSSNPYRQTSRMSKRSLWNPWMSINKINKYLGTLVI